jgi:maleate isomerase
MGLARLGLIVPSSNTVAESDFARSLPESVSLHTARMFLDETTEAQERTMLERHAPRAATDLGTAKPDAVVFCCTSAGAILGVDGEAALEARLEALAGAPIVSTNAAVGRCLEQVGARRVTVVTAYVEELNRAIAATLEQRGFEVAAITGMGITDNFAIAEVEPDEIVRFASDRVRPGSADVLFVSCTNLRSLEAAAALCDLLDMPVVTSNMASISVALERIGLPALEAKPA